MSYPLRPSPVNSSSNPPNLEYKHWEKIEENGPPAVKQDHEAAAAAALMECVVPQAPAIYGRSLRVTPRHHQNGGAKRPRVGEGEFLAEECCDGGGEATTMPPEAGGEDCDAFGRSVAAQLRQMNHVQKCIAQRLISEALFRGQMQILQMNTTLATQAPAMPQPAGQHGAFYAVRNNINPGFGRDILMQAARQMQQQQQQQSVDPSVPSGGSLAHGEM